MKSTKKLRELLKSPGVIQAGGVGDAGQARLVEKVGYPAVYMSGSYVNYTYGVPDGTLTMSEIAARVGAIADRISIPLIADADEGFGDVLEIIRTVQTFEKAGAAALHMEDMSVKKHGQPIPLPEMINRIKAALDARRDPDLVIIARTDAMAHWRGGVEANRAACEKDAFERSVAYADAGADIIMPMFPTIDWVKRFFKQIPKPILMLYPSLSVKELEPYNVKIVIYPNNILLKTFGLMKSEYAAWLAAGKVEFTEQDKKDKAEINALLGVPEKEKLLAKYGE